MENREAIKKQLGKLTSIELEKLKQFQNEIERIITKNTIDEDSLRSLDLLCSELEIFRTTYYWRIIKLLKLNHKIT